MEMQKKNLIKLIFATALFEFAFLPCTASAIPDRGYDHHQDTEEYCMQVNDVTIGMTEIGKYQNDDELFGHILDMADPVVYMWEYNKESRAWIQLARDDLEYDFSAFKREACEEGYPVAIKAPPVWGETESTVVMYVYVLDDMPVQRYARVSFAGTDMEDKVFDITDGGVEVSIKELPGAEKSGFRFCGWFLDPEWNTPFLLTDDSAGFLKQTIQGDLVLYPGFEIITALSGGGEQSGTYSGGSADAPPTYSGEGQEETSASVFGVPDLPKDSSGAPQSSTTKETPKVKLIENVPIQPTVATQVKSEQKVPVDGHNMLSKNDKKTGRRFRAERLAMHIAFCPLLLICVGLSYSILSDVCVLRWYKKKKGLDYNVRKSHDHSRTGGTVPVKRSRHIDQSVSPPALEGH